MNEEHLLETAIRAAQEGGQLALEHLGQPGRVKWKGAQDVVTAGTLVVQERIVQIIHQEFPEHAILSEELDERPDPEAESLWIIDPIDGSLNYMQGIPFFAVAVGFRHKNVYRVGVVYDPGRDELFHAARNQGAFLNDRRIITRGELDGMEAYQVAVVATDWPAQVQKRAATIMIVRLMAAEVAYLQILGSPALALCYIAAGRLDAYFHLQLDLWDIAAASVILEEANGVLTDADGVTWQHSDGGYLASNGIIHGRMLDPIRAARKRREMYTGRSPASS